MNVVLAASSHVSSRPDEERDGGGSDDGEEEEFGDAHCGKARNRKKGKGKIEREKRSTMYSTGSQFSIFEIAQVSEIHKE